MTRSNHTLPLPPLTRTSQGELRRVGVELELIDLDIHRISQLVAAHVNGRVEKLTAYEHRIHGDPAGPWGVELDFTYLKARAREKAEEDPKAEGLLEDLEAAAEELLRKGAEQIVPMEVVSPPLPMDRLGTVEALVDALRDAGARGTTDGLTYAFGMQLNPEMPATDAATITRYLKAFLCLFDWLEARAEVDFTRRLTAYVDPFPKAYVRTVVDPGYRPDLTTLMDDYLAANPTRNRALDLLPLFCHLDPARVRAAIDDPRVKPRPALHYRLPNCEIDRPDWGIAPTWLDWLQVEHLAAEPERLDALCERYSSFLERPLAGLFRGWAKQVEPWLVPVGEE